MFRAIEYIPTDGSRIAFCDGSAYHPDDGHPAPIIRYAAWFAADCCFEVREEVVDIDAKGHLIRMAECKAIELAMQFSPEIIYTDYQRMAGKITDSVTVEWLRRKHNRIADMLTRSPAGTGYIAFNATEPGRDWIDFIYD